MNQNREPQGMRDNQELHDVKRRARAGRGFNLMPVGHESTPLTCPVGHPLEIAAGVFITVDASSGIALIEISPQEKKVRVTVNGHDVLDVSQLARGGVLGLGGKDYVLLRYMDVYFNPSPLSLPVESARRAQVLPIRSAKQPRPRSLKRVIKLAGPALLLLGAASALVFMPARAPTRGPSGHAVGNPAGHAPTAQQVVEKNAEKTLRDLMTEVPAENPAPAAAVVVSAQPAPQATEKSPAIQVKPEAVKQVKKSVQPAAPVASRPTLPPEVLKSLTREYEEAVLIRGYDRDRSIRVLENLRKKVPHGSALHKKIESALKG